MSELPQTKSSREDAVEVVRRLREAGHVAYFAGGCVRDLLLGREPKDFDVATDAPPQRVRQLFLNTQAVGAAFGVILVRLRRSMIEVATFRTDGSYTDGRRPDAVRFTTAEEDAKRRDFTINGMFLDPVEDRVIDYVGGQQDLRDGLLRAIGNPHERFEEDHLRLLRAVRFAARFGLRIEPATASAISAHAERLQRISPERVAEELRQILTPVTRDTAWRMLWEHRLIHVILRMMPKGEAPPTELDPGRSIFLALVPGQSVSFGVALAAGVICYRWHARLFPTDMRPLLEKSQVQVAAQATRQALKISNEELAEMSESMHGLAILLAEEEPGVAKLKRFLARPAAAESRAMLEALAARGLHAERAAWLRPRLDDLAKTDFAPPPLLTGDDLTAAGQMPGPVFKRVLEAVYDAQLEGRISIKEDALAMGLSLATRP